jgi:urea carboxylase
VKYRAIDREAYDEAIEQVESHRFYPAMRDTRFALDAFKADPGGYTKKLEDLLHGV